MNYMFKRQAIFITVLIGVSFLYCMKVYAQVDHDSAPGPVPYQNTSTYDQDKAAETNVQEVHDVAPGPVPYQDTSTYDQDKAGETNIPNSSINNIVDL